MPVANLQLNPVGRIRDHELRDGVPQELRNHGFFRGIAAKEGVGANLNNIAELNQIKLQNTNALPTIGSQNLITE
jgi:hypothetical protein